MTGATRKLALLALLAPARVLGGEPEPDVEGVMVERDTVQVSPQKGAAITRVELDNRMGDLQVIGWDGDGMMLQVVKRAPDGATLDRLKVNLVPGENGVYRISTGVVPGGKDTRTLTAGVVRIDMVVQVPRRAAVDLKGWNGKLAVSGMHAEASLTGNDADIEVSDVEGDVTTASTKGSHHLTGVLGAVSAKAAYGEVALERIGGDSLEARLHDGSIAARRIASRSVTITTTFGNISFEGELYAGGSYSLRSYRGDVTVAAGGTAFRLDAWARDGEVDSRLELADEDRAEKGRLTGRFGPARKKPALLEVSSVAGTIHLGLMNE